MAKEREFGRKRYRDGVIMYGIKWGKCKVREKERVGKESKK